MRFTEAQLKQIIQEEVDQMIEEGWKDRWKSRYAGFKAAGAKTGPRQLARDIGKRLAMGAKVTASGDPSSVEKHEFAGSAEYQSAKTERAVSLYKGKILAFAAELENDIELMGIDPGAFGVLPASLKALAVGFEKSLTAEDGISKEQFDKIMADHFTKMGAGRTET